jgi:hypothetical protein
VKKLEFVVPGDPSAGAYISKPSRFGKNKDRVERYWKYCEKVRIYAKQAGLQLPLEASKTTPVFIHVASYFENGRHADPENCAKGLRDALFYRAEGGDKHCGGSHFCPLYDPIYPRSEVTVEFWTRGEMQKEFLDGRLC